MTDQPDAPDARRLVLSDEERQDLQDVSSHLLDLIRAAQLLFDTITAPEHAPTIEALEKVLEIAVDKGRTLNRALDLVQAPDRAA